MLGQVNDKGGLGWGLSGRVIDWLCARPELQLTPPGPHRKGKEKEGGGSEEIGVVCLIY